MDVRVSREAAMVNVWDGIGEPAGCFSPMWESLRMAIRSSSTPAPISRENANAAAAAPEPLMNARRPEEVSETGMLRIRLRAEAFAHARGTGFQPIPACP